MPHTEEVLTRWGDTAAYAEYTKRTKNYKTEDFLKAKDGFLAIFAEFAMLNSAGVLASSAAVGELVAKLRAHITAHFYTCTPELLVSLGEMYVADERFRQNIDAAGEGTAVFVRAAIAAHVPTNQRR